jgi:ribosomal protein S18 acetylase RimI-like enzyme
VIRAATHGDVDALAAVLAELPLLQRYGTQASKLAEQLHAGIDRGDWIWVHEGGGVCWVMPSAAFGHAYLRLIALVPDAQGAGWGGKLMDCAEAEARKNERHLFLLVTKDNDGARRFYARRGYVETGVLPGYVREGVDEVIAVRRWQ